MNAIVLVALRKPLTFVVMSLLILLFGGLAVVRTPTDVFPNIGIPVVAVVWTYNGLSPQDMSGRVIYYYERSLTTTVGNIEHIESQSYYGRGVVKIFLQPGTDVAAAQAQITATSQTVLKQMPAGITPPQVLSYSASSVPVLDLQVAAAGLTAAQVYDMASNLIRPQLVAVPGAAIPTPYGGTSLNVEIDLDQKKLLAHGLSAVDVGQALKNQNVVLPAGDQKIGALDYMVETNASPLAVASFNDLPIRTTRGATVVLSDVAYVHRGSPPQINEVLVHGKQAVLIEVLKSGSASTLAVVAGVKAKLPGILRTLPPGVTITPLADASAFVRDSVSEVVQEMVTAAFLTGITVLVFLGSWRSTLIVVTSIPLAILTSVLMLSWFGQTINVMTLGGLALAVGILVDDATVVIENIDAHLDRGAELEPGIIEAANENRGADLRLHAVHLHRLAAAVPAVRHCRLPVPAAGRGGDLRHAGLVRAVAHAGADDGRLPSARPDRTARACGPPRPVRPVPARLQRAVSPLPTRLPGRAGGDRGATRALRPGVLHRRLRIARPDHVPRPRLLPVDQVRRDRHAHARPRRHAAGGRGRDRRAGQRFDSPVGCPARSATRSPIAGCRSAASTRPTAPPAPSDRRTATSASA